MFKKDEYMERIVSTGQNYAYLKIGEGCSNMCTYCAIPYIRGPFESRPMEDIIKEAEMLAEKGIKEIIVIAQDTTKYGIDIYGEPKLHELLQNICKIEGIKENVLTGKRGLIKWILNITKTRSHYTPKKGLC